jgi:glycosyltransferase involved in cell wall biosynthesis
MRARPRAPDRTARPPKLLHVSIGGPTLHSYFAGQLAYMRAHGFDVVIAAQGGPDLDRLCRREGVRGRPVDLVRTLRPWRDLWTLAALLRIVAEERPDVVHCHTPKAALLGLLAAFIQRVPHRIYHLRTLPLETQRGALRPLLYASEVLVARLATQIMAISPSLRRAYRAWPGLSHAPITVLGAGSGNGVDGRGRFHPERITAAEVIEFRRWIGLPAEAPALCFVGRLARDKGFAELHAAWQELRDRYPDLWLIVAGDADERQPVPPGPLEALRHDARVAMPGFVYERELVFAASALNVLPTYREGFGSVLIEAAAMGIPAVASRVTGCVDAIVDGVSGTLVPPRSVPALVEAIARYLEDPALRARHGAAARDRALREFAPESIWARLRAFYATALGERGVAAGSADDRREGIADAPVAAPGASQDWAAGIASASDQPAAHR